MAARKRSSIIYLYDYSLPASLSSDFYLTKLDA